MTFRLNMESLEARENPAGPMPVEPIPIFPLPGGSAPMPSTLFPPPPTPTKPPTPFDIAMEILAGAMLPTIP